MVALVLVFAYYYVISYSTVPVAGQCTVSSCANSGSEETLQISLEEHDHRLETMNQNMCSAFEKLEAAVNRTNARDQGELCQDLKTLYYNMSVNLERVSEKIPERFEWHATQEQEEYFRVLNLSLTSMTVRTEERIQAVNESLSSILHTVNRRLDEKFQVIQVQIQDQPSAEKNVNRSLNEKFQAMQVQLQSQASVNRTNARDQEELYQDLKTLYYNISVNLDSLNEKIPERFECHAIQKPKEYLRVMNLSLTSMTARTEERIQAVNESLSSIIQTVNRRLDEKFQVMQEQIQDQSSALQNVNRSLNEKFQVIQVQLQSQYSALKIVNRSLDDNCQVMQVELSSLPNDSVVAVLKALLEKFHTHNEAPSSAIVKSTGNEKLHASFDRVKESNQSVESEVDHCQSSSDVCDCSDIKANGYRTSGVYRIYVIDQGQRYYANVFCDMTTTNGRWMVFQRRKDGSVDFFRGWTNYENGFGNLNGEFWLGNNFLHLLTSKRRYLLRIDMEDFEGGKRYAEYSTFHISSSADNYRLRIGSYYGNAGDSFNIDNGYRFSTKDSDNDAVSGNCAVSHRGAWWYGSCSHSNLNGLYLRGRYSSNGSFNGWEGIRWDRWYSQWYSLKTTEMKISSF